MKELLGKIKNRLKALTFTHKIIGFVVIAIAIGGVLAVVFTPKSKPQIDYSAINSICELATLKSYCHNVITIDKDGNLISEMLNENHYWVEYTGIIESGVDAGKIKYSDPDENGVVEVYIPDAEVFTVYVDPDSFSEPITDKGLFKPIKTKEKLHELSNTQDAMLKNANKDEAMLKRAKQNAMNLIEDYIINVGEAIGTNYTVKWVSK